jgi:hypothetical protein
MSRRKLDPAFEPLRFYDQVWDGGCPSYAPEAADPPKSKAPEKAKKKNPHKTFWLTLREVAVKSELPRAAKSGTACSVSERARTFVHEQLADEPRAGSQIEAAPEALDNIPERC